MNAEKRRFIQNRINLLKQRKEALVQQTIGACNEINLEIKELQKQLKEGK